MVERNILNDVCAITTISKIGIEKIAKSENMCIIHSVYEASKEKETCLCLDIGIGKLCVGIEPDKVLYKFIPSANLEKGILSIIDGGESPLTGRIEDALRTKISEAYKEFGI